MRLAVPVVIKLNEGRNDHFDKLVRVLLLFSYRLKLDRQYSRDMFVFLLFLLVFTAFVFTIKNTTDKLLNRVQTEEWKGWVQVLQCHN